MQKSNTNAGIATISQLQRDILLNTKGQYMKESNTFAGNATIKQNRVCTYLYPVNVFVKVCTWYRKLLVDADIYSMCHK